MRDSSYSLKIRRERRTCGSLTSCVVTVRRILTQLRAAAGPQTKLLVGDMLLPNACADEAAYESADGSAATFPFVSKDSPLLPNLGVGNILVYLMDILVRGSLPVYRIHVVHGISLMKNSMYAI